MKTERISLLIGVIITFGIFGFSLKYYEYKSTPAVQRIDNPLLEAVEVLDLRFNDFKYKLRQPVHSEAPV
ncbi:MAG: hypothetical protein ACXVCE_14525, partial [Bacteriovorax sp.]